MFNEILVKCICYEYVSHLRVHVHESFSSFSKFFIKSLKDFSTFFVGAWNTSFDAHPL